MEKFMSNCSNKIKLLTKKKSLVLFLSVLISSPLFASVSNELPTGYTRSNVQKQLLEYRNIFDPIYKEISEENPEYSRVQITKEMSRKHADKLIDVFEDGIKITNNFIRENQYQIFLEDLKKIWSFAEEINNEKKFSSNVFSALNNALALLASRCKGESINLRNAQSIDEEDINIILISIRKIANNETNIDKYKMEKDYSTFEHFFPDRPNFIIYGHPDSKKRTKISEKTFVDQFFKFPYSGYICLYDVNSKQKQKRTKSDAHFSSENGTFNMLRHDQEHNYFICKMEDKYTIFEDWFSALEKAYRMIAELNESDSNIIYSGLFEFFHDESMERFSKEKQKSPYEYIRDAVENIKETGKSRLYNYSRINYKEEFRDAENILKNKNENGQEFLPRIHISEDKSRPFPIAETKEGKYIIVKDQSEFTKDMKWVIPQKDAPEAIRQERVDKYLKLAVEKGNNKFWDRFLAIFLACQDASGSFGIVEEDGSVR